MVGHRFRELHIEDWLPCCWNVLRLFSLAHTAKADCSVMRYHVHMPMWQRTEASFWPTASNELSTSVMRNQMSTNMCMNLGNGFNKDSFQLLIQNAVLTLIPTFFTALNLISWGKSLLTPQPRLGTLIWHTPCTLHLSFEVWARIIRFWSLSKDNNNHIWHFRGTAVVTLWRKHGYWEAS